VLCIARVQREAVTTPSGPSCAQTRSSPAGRGAGLPCSVLSEIRFHSRLELLCILQDPPPTNALLALLALRGAERALGRPQCLCQHRNLLNCDSWPSGQTVRRLHRDLWQTVIMLVTASLKLDDRGIGVPYRPDRSGSTGGSFSGVKLTTLLQLVSRSGNVSYTSCCPIRFHGLVRS
jgi:hypothetical protein